MAMPGMGIVTLENPDYWISNCGGKAYRILNHGPGSVHLKHTDSVTDSFESSQGGVKIVIAANQTRDKRLPPDGVVGLSLVEKSGNYALVEYELLD